MEIPDDEIVVLYRQAKNQKEQVKVLAELNDVPIWEMRMKLWELGCVSKKPPPRKRKEKPPEKRSGTKAANYMARRRQALREMGLCIWCGREPADGRRSLCQACREKSKKKATNKG